MSCSDNKPIAVWDATFNTSRPMKNGRSFADDTLKWKCYNFDYDFTEICSQESNKHYFSIGLDNGLAPTWQQLNIWTNDG